MSNRMKEVANMLGVELYEKFFVTRDKLFYYFTDTCLMCGYNAFNSAADSSASNMLVCLLNGSYEVIKIYPDKLLEKAIKEKRLDFRDYELLLYNDKFFNMKCIEYYIDDCGMAYYVFKYNDKFYQIRFFKNINSKPDYTSFKVIKVVPKEVNKTIWEEVK